MERKLFYLCLFALIVTLGCLGGGGGGGGGSSTGAGSTLGRIAGTVSTTGILASLSPASSSDPRAAMGFTQAIAYLEENPNYSTIVGANGTFLIENIPFGTYHVVARILSLTGTTYKVRTPILISVTPEAPQGACSLSVTPADKADRQIRIQVKNPSGISIPGCVVTLWGEAFTFEGNGIYLSPFFPAGAQGDVRVEAPLGAGFQTLTIAVNAGTFASGPPLPVIGGTLIPVNVLNRAPIVYLSAAKDTLGGNETLELQATVYDPEGDAFITSWTATVGDFANIATQSATWLAGSRKGSATITLSAIENSGKIPKMTTQAQLVMNIASDAPIPGLSVAITGTATTQISGELTADFFAVASFPGGVLGGLIYSWAISNGTPTSAGGSTLRWKSPAVALGSSIFATMSVLVYHPDDPLYNASRTIVIQVTPAPIVAITAPVNSIFTPSLISFAGTATDYDGSPISLASLSWFLATGSQPLSLLKTGATTFDYLFTTNGTFTVSFVARNAQNVAATATKNIIIVNATPTATIFTPGNNSVWPASFAISFTGQGNDLEDGPITNAGSLTWYDDPPLAATFSIGNGTSFTRTDLALGTHTISLRVVDSKRKAATESIRIYVNASPTVSFTPLDLAVFFGGHTVPFRGGGTDTAGLSLPASAFNWYRNGVLFQSGASSFSAPIGSIPSGTHLFSLTGTDGYGFSSSGAHIIAVGYPLATITAPASGLVILAGSPITFTGTPDSTGTMKMQWWYDYGTMGGREFGQGPTIICATLPAGMRDISYIGTDSQGVVSSGSIRIRIFQNVAMDILQPVNSGIYFGGQTVLFQGVGTETTTGIPISPASMTWFRSEAPFFIPTPFRVGTSAFALSPAELGTGTITFTLEGQGSTGATGAWSITALAGHTLASISSPASGTRIDSAGTINLAATPANTGTLVMEWYRDFTTLLGNNTPLNAVPIPNGWHTITYLGTDTAGTVSSSSIQILAQNVPPMEIIPTSGAILFGGPLVSLIGSGTEVGTAIPIAPGTMKWYLDGSPVVWQSGSPINATPGNPATGAHQVKLSGTDSLGAEGSTTASIYFGYPVASITLPASGTHFPIGSTVNFTGTPNSSGTTIVMTWYLDNTTVIGNGQAISYAVPPGLHTITYIATDSVGAVSRSDIQIVLDDVPTMSFTPVNNSVIFGGHSFTLTGTGTNAIGGGPVVPGTMRWYLDSNFGSVWKSGSPVTVNIVDLATGAHDITLTGVDQFGVVGTVTYNLTYGYSLATITSPASGTMFPLGTNVPFTGSPNSVGPLTMEWYLDDSVLLGTGDTVSSVIPNGNHTLTYVGTDSTGFASKGTIQVLMDNPPAMVFTPGNNSILFGGYSFTLTGGGTHSVGGGAVDPLTMKWYLDGSFGAPWKTGGSPVVTTADIATGNHLVTLAGADQFGKVGTTTVTLYYGYDVATITVPASGTVYPIGANVNFTGFPNSSGTIIMQWYRDTTTFLGAGSALTDAVPAGNHNFTYIGTDSAGRATRGDIQVLMDAVPTMSITPADDSIVFGGHSFSLIGTGTHAIGGANVDPTTMKWYLDGSFAAAWKTNSPVTVNLGELATGNHQITLTGADQFGKIGTITNDLYFGFPVATITAPASGSTFALGSNVNFTGFPDSSGTVAMVWYRDLTTLLGAGAALTDAVPNGNHTFTYVGTDSTNYSTRADIQVLMDSPPTMSFTPGNNSIIFGGHAFSMTGAGTNSIGGGPVAAGTMKWYLDGSFAAPWKTSSPITVNLGDLSTGTHQITLTGADQFGKIGTISNNLYFGYPVASITSPASGTRFNQASSQVFNGVPDSSGTLIMEWYQEYLTAFATPRGTGAVSAVVPFTNGWNKVTYVATDSTGFVSENTIYVLADNPPTMSFKPINNGIIFGGYNYTLSGSGTQSIGGGAVNASTLKWYRDGSFAAAWKTGANPTVTIGELATGAHSITLTGEDQFGIVGTLTNTVYIGFNVASITSPASGTRFAFPSSVSFTGTPDSSGTFTLEWYRNYGTGGPLFDTGAAPAAYAVPYGRHKITYLATDALDFVSSSSINVLMNNPPDMRILPGADAVFFGGQTVTLTGVGTDTSGVSILPANMRWYRSGLGGIWKTGSPITITPGEIASSTYTISLEGIDTLGTIGTRTQDMTIGYTLASITAPASGTRFETLDIINFTAVPNSPATFTMQWYSDYGTAGAQFLGNNAAISTAGIASGWHNITYVGTDSQGLVSSNTIRLLVNQLPKFQPFAVNKPLQYATNSENIGIFLASGGATVIFNATATDYEIGPPGTDMPGASLTWYLPPDPLPKGTGNTLTRLFDTPGSYTLMVVATDSFGNAASATFFVWIWDVETYDTFDFQLPATPTPFLNLSGPTSISANGNEIYVADPGNARILKLNRIPGGLSTSGDIGIISTETIQLNPGVMTNSLTSLTYNGGRLFSVESNVAGNNRMQEFSPGTLAQIALGAGFTKTVGAGADQLNNPSGIAIDPVAIYLSDTGNNRVKKFDIGNGAFYAEQYTALSVPRELYYSSANLFIADSANNRVVKVDSSLNALAWGGTSASGAASVVLGLDAPPKVYASNNAGNNIHVFNNSGTYLYSFGGGGTGLGQFNGPWGLAIVLNDLYIVERGGNRIHRIRSGGW